MVYIEYRCCPTNFSPPVTISTDWAGLPRLLKLLSLRTNRIILSDYAKRMGHTGPSGTVVQYVYEEREGTKLVHYKHRGFDEPHLSDALRSELAEVKEVLV